MNFNSLQFLIFLPTVLILYFALPHKARWVVLLVASYYFYMSWNAWLVFLILGTTAVSYAAAVAISKSKTARGKKAWLAATLVVCLGLLVFFKYFNFLIQSATDFLNLFSLDIDSFALDIILPVGISFYTFQTLSYVIEVYRGKYAAEKHFGYYALFVCYFPQLVAGPIERPQDLIPQLKEKHRLNADDLAAGFRILLCGFLLKCVVADFCGIFVNNVFGNIGDANAVSVFAAGLLFYIQMFGDFAGYSLIATGAARMMGVRLSRNFDRPYLAVSYSDFFRRWHITLTRWFTEYVYVPLGGNRKGTARRIVNTFVVFILCGLWHGANFTYVCWGLYAAFFVSLEAALRKPVKSLLKAHGIDPHARPITIARRVAMWLVFVPAALMFRSQSLAQFGEIFSKLFTACGGDGAYFGAAAASLGIDAISAIRLVLAIACMCLVHYIERYEKPTAALPLGARAALAQRTYGSRAAVYFYAIFAVAFFWLALLASQDSSVFLYFQF